MAKESHRVSLLKPKDARTVAIIVFCVGIILGALDAPSFVNEQLHRINVEYRIPTTWIPYRFGLDIQGGTHLVYGADVSGVSESDHAVAMNSVRDIIERRVNLFGVSEPIVQIQRRGEDWRLIVELAGVHDINAAIRLIGETPFLEFREERSQEERDAILKTQSSSTPPTEDPYFKPTALTGRFVKRAAVAYDQLSFQPQISLELTGEGAKIFEELTEQNVGKRIAIYLDGAPISAPVVQEKITGGRAQITGQFSDREAKILVGRLNSGALPVPIKLISQQSVGASLGNASLARSLRAGFIGFLVLAIFMVLWYRLPGALAVLALLIYIAISLMIFKLIPVTLTLAGIVGFILSLGMAVDANILIFERTKEELRRGKSTPSAIQEGFQRAWTSIRDSNISSLITASLLYWIGTSAVQGFALTLAIGVLVSMFSAIFVTRSFLFAVLTKRLAEKKTLFLSGFLRNC